MALKHANPLDVIDLHATDEQRGTHGSSSLLKTAHLQLLQIVLPAGDEMPQHHVPGEVTIQCLAGEAAVTTPHGTCTLREGQLVALPEQVPHAVQARDDSTLLVTLIRKPGDAGPGSP
ncbi:MAG: cupin domain-containing protein [Pigmentiphaga sp.]|uniref:cupin domain-containing protein n=1 Tax=Pigmentiphaga sp. TaxID=1977564 RepID=UPI0029A9A228|nr:cupin domain-containing protein [Pigmentiphaga sp.]MDX3905078.1 cupin domain-containing protein [Pigmentiphaga sp.]